VAAPTVIRHPVTGQLAVKLPSTSNDGEDV